MKFMSFPHSSLLQVFHPEFNTHLGVLSANFMEVAMLLFICFIFIRVTYKKPNSVSIHLDKQANWKHTNLNNWQYLIISYTFLKTDMLTQARHIFILDPIPTSRALKASKT